jgi:hypothetical protein
LAGSFFNEAVTVGPTVRDGRSVETAKPHNEAELRRYMTHYLPIKFAGPLTKKLSRRYWEQAHIGRRPIVLAIADFHYPMSITWSQTGLVTYLYGYAHKWHHDDQGKLVIDPERIQEHSWGAKTVPSGFFNLPDSEHISAVISSRAATISKFNRMGLKAGFGSPRVRMIRKGKRYVDDPNRAEPEDFVVAVHEPKYEESWAEGLEVYHNPLAANPIDPEMLPGGTHHFLKNGQVITYCCGSQTFGSLTFISLEGQGNGVAIEEM